MFFLLCLMGPVQNIRKLVLVLQREVNFSRNMSKVFVYIKYNSQEWLTNGRRFQYTNFP